MKKTLLFLLAFFLLLGASAQGKSGDKNKSKANPAAARVDTLKEKRVKNNAKLQKDKDRAKQKQEKAQRDEHDRKIWDGVNGTAGCGISSRNQPAKVRAAFQRDYPNAAALRWTKCRGDWTATFQNGPFLSTVFYHANGDRKDTRTPVTQERIPRRVLDTLFKRRPGINIGDVIRIELPRMEEIFRIRAGTAEKPEFLFLNLQGEMIRYEY